MRLKVLVAAVAAVAVILVAASSALAATVTSDGTTITVAGADTAEVLRINFDDEAADPDTYEFDDQTGAVVTPGAGCAVDDDDATKAQCPTAGVTRIVINLAGGDDAVRFVGTFAFVPATISGGDGNDGCSGAVVEGTGLADTINGDAGNDCIAGRGGDDTIDGGAGDDDVDGNDANDTVRGGDGGDFVGGSDGDDPVLDGGAGGDTVRGNEGNDGISGGTGSDFALGGPGVDTMSGGDGDDDLRGLEGNDTLTGEGGDDALNGGAGADVMNGGAGFDLVDYSFRGPTEHVTVTLDGQANDGEAAEGDNVLESEDIAGGAGGDTLRGSAASEISIMRGNAGNDFIDPAALEDIVFAGAGDDGVEARDGFTDRVSCGEGTDTVTADTLDVVSPDCETVVREDRGVARDIPEDVPPTVTFTAPGPGATVAARTTLTANASDDRGVARVLFIDEDRTVCTDDTAPYTCDYQPRDEDVGRNTLTAVAVDTANQTGFSTRTVRVPRFRPGISIRVTPRADRRVPFRFRTTGRLTLPVGVTPLLGCRGVVTVQIKSRGNTISTRRARVLRNCRYSSRVTFRVTRRLVTNRLTVRATFGGNDVLVRRLSRRVSVRVRR